MGWRPRCCSACLAAPATGGGRRRRSTCSTCPKASPAWCWSTGCAQVWPCLPCGRWAAARTAAATKPPDSQPSLAPAVHLLRVRLPCASSFYCRRGAAGGVCKRHGLLGWVWGPSHAATRRGPRAAACGWAHRWASQPILLPTGINHPAFTSSTPSGQPAGSIIYFKPVPACPTAHLLAGSLACPQAPVPLCAACTTSSTGATRLFWSRRWHPGRRSRRCTRQASGAGLQPSSRPSFLLRGVMPLPLGRLARRMNMWRLRPCGSLPCWRQCGLPLPGSCSLALCSMLCHQA